MCLSHLRELWRRRVRGTIAFILGITNYRVVALAGIIFALAALTTVYLFLDVQRSTFNQDIIEKAFKQGIWKRNTDPAV